MLPEEIGRVHVPGHKGVTPLSPREITWLMRLLRKLLSTQRDQCLISPLSFRPLLRSLFLAPRRKTN
jgi:hypothetical protein